jgi:P-type Ca2+ transporter type 2C
MATRSSEFRNWPAPASQKTTEQQWRGLTDGEAQDRLSAEGFNQLPSARERSFWRTTLEVLREPMLLLLVATGVVYVLLGDPLEAGALLVAVFVIIGITLVQERKTERALHALRDLSSPRALVVRDGVRKRIAGREVVRRDLAIISEGDRVPADGVLLESRNVSVDESLLTGESAPVPKTEGPHSSPMGRPGGNDTPFVFSGTLMVKGRGVVEVLATGVNTELGKIGKSLASLQTETTRLQQETNRLVRVLVMAGVGLCIAVVVVFGYMRRDWLHGILAGLTLAISMVPEEFPVVLTVFLALGAWRISRQQVLTRRMPAIETLGAATVLCVDKTGTLTMNRMSVQTLFADNQWLDVEESRGEIPEGFHKVVEYSILASSRDPFDPMEKAFRELGNRFPQFAEHLHPDWKLAREYPLSPQLMAMSRVWAVAGDGDRRIAAKGAPEAIGVLCRMTPQDEQGMDAAVKQMAARGLRVLAVAKAELSAELPDDQRALPFEFVGLVGLADPLRPSVPAAIEECHRAGIRVVMITGDYPVTAQNMAAQAGFGNRDSVLTGAELETLSDSELRRRVCSVDIFARVVPEQKLRIVKALKASGEVVAMTGDGVNDAPALKAADIGIAMGNRGTDVAREAAALVLLDDDFSSIVNAIRQGRRIYDNLKKATRFILAVHVPIGGVALTPLLLGWPMLLMPVHVVFLELIIDPACSIAFEAEPAERTVMARPPRDRNERLFGKERVLKGLLQGFAVFVAAILVYGVFLHLGRDQGVARAAAFTSLVFGNLGLIFTNRSSTRTILETLGSKNPFLWVIVGGSVSTLLLTFYVPVLRNLFRFSPLSLSDMFIAVLAGLLGVAALEGVKVLARMAGSGRPQAETSS